MTLIETHITQAIVIRTSIYKRKVEECISKKAVSEDLLQDEVE